jgi:hypothetical protein
LGKFLRAISLEHFIEGRVARKTARQHIFDKIDFHLRHYREEQTYKNVQIFQLQLHWDLGEVEKKLERAGK